MIDALRAKAAAMDRKATKHFIVACAVTKKGNVIGMATNLPADYPGILCKHAEGRLMLRYGRKISTIYIARFGRDGKQLPIEACDMCKRVAQRFGIIIKELI